MDEEAMNLKDKKDVKDKRKCTCETAFVGLMAAATHAITLHVPTELVGRNQIQDFPIWSGATDIDGVGCV